MNQNGNAFGHDKNGENHGAIASSLGRLNAAHASPTARANASPNSVVGIIAAYEAEVKAAEDAEAVAAAAAAAVDTLAEAANKGYPDDAVVAAVNNLLGIEATEDAPDATAEASADESPEGTTAE